MFPGVYHCGGGYGPSHFDMATAITAWVEHSIAPDKIMATKYS
jgi:Tannase and feruloyl esterase